MLGGSARRDAIQHIDAEKKAGDIPEDDAKRGHDAIDKLLKKFEGQIDEAVASKTKEVMEV